MEMVNNWENKVRKAPRKRWYDAKKKYDNLNNGSETTTCVSG